MFTSLAFNEILFWNENLTKLNAKCSIRPSRLTEKTTDKQSVVFCDLS